VGHVPPRPPGALREKIRETGLAMLEDALRALPEGAIREQAIERID
jgi:hypothetical protein